MDMLHVIGIILKIIGILLAVLLGTLVMVILLALFVPVRYRFFIKKRDDMLIDGKVHWLLHLIHGQTSVRTAGQTILIGVNQVQSPYKIQAIGNSADLADAVGERSQPSLYKTLKSAGIFPQVSTSKSITLEAASSSDISYAERAD